MADETNAQIMNSIRFYIDTADNDPYSSINVLDGSTNKLVLAYWQDDAPVHDFNAEQHRRAHTLCEYLNGLSTTLEQNLFVHMLAHSSTRKS